MESRPQCIGFIMDGNRRWASERGEDTLAGHVAGKETFKQAVRFLRDEQIPHGVFYAFSTENWRRSEQEVAALLNLFIQSLAELREASTDEKVAIRIIGKREDFSRELQLDLAELEERSAKYRNRTTIWVALSYGGRAEIVEAVNKAIATGKPVTEASFTSLLQTADMPDPDIIVRTSGEERLSNFLPWQSVYSELYFLEKQWPALTEEDFKDILTTYAKRQRRHGK